MPRKHKIERPSGGRPRERENFPPSLTRRMIRQHKYLVIPLFLFGPYRCAEEIIRRYKEWCKQGDHEFVLDYAITEAAKKVGLPTNKLRNWYLRSKKIRDREP